MSADARNNPARLDDLFGLASDAVKTAQEADELAATTAPYRPGRKRNGRLKKVAVPAATIAPVAHTRTLEPERPLRTRISPMRNG